MHDLRITARDISRPALATLLAQGTTRIVTQKYKSAHTDDPATLHKILEHIQQDKITAILIYAGILTVKIMNTL